MAMGAVKRMWRNRYLVWQLTKREVAGRYRGSHLGLIWSLIHPLVMLIVYTFVFSVVFQARWGVSPNETRAEFALVLFAGLIIFHFFSDVMNRSPLLVVSNPAYVKKIIFPIELLPIVTILSSLFQFLVSFSVLIIGQILINKTFPLTIILLPFLFLPFMLFSLGASWLLSSFGVYFRDIAHLMSIATTLLLFMSPVFYPLSAVPENLQPLLALNPLTFFLEAARQLLIFGQVPKLSVWALYSAASLVVATVGYWWFQRARKGFADVL